MRDRMPETTDFTTYEAARAAHHELWSRRAATVAFLQLLHCRRRACRRTILCGGPMVPSARQEGAVAAQRALGLSGAAVACLPLCAASCGDTLFEDFKAALAWLLGRPAGDGAPPGR